VVVAVFCGSHKATQEAVSAMDINPLTETTDFEAVCDNRDCAVLVSWDPSHRWACRQIISIITNTEHGIEM